MFNDSQINFVFFFIEQMMEFATYLSIGMSMLSTWHQKNSALSQLTLYIKVIVSLLKHAQYIITCLLHQLRYFFSPNSSPNANK